MLVCISRAAMGVGLGSGMPSAILLGTAGRTRLYWRRIWGFGIETILVRLKPHWLPRFVDGRGRARKIFKPGSGDAADGFSNKFDFLLATNKSELATGYCTL